MENLFETIFNTFGWLSILLIFLFILAWAMVPYIIIGTNSRLDKINKNLVRILEIMEKGNPDEGNGGFKIE